MEAVMFAVPMAGLGMIAAGIALSVKPAPVEPAVRRLITRSELESGTAGTGLRSRRRWPFQQRPVSADRCREKLSASAPGVSMEPENRTDPWYRNLDSTICDDDVAARCALAESLGSVRARWAGTFLHAALATEPDATVRARLIAAMFRAMHVTSEEPLVDALARGGVERAVVLERLSLSGELPQWAMPFAGDWSAVHDRCGGDVLEADALVR